MRCTDRWRKATVPACVATAVVALLTGGAFAQEKAPTTRAAPAGAGAADLNVNERGTVELHVQGADLRRVLQLLSTQSRTNIIATKDVQGTVTADLYEVTFTEALEAVLNSAGFRYVRKGNLITVMTPEEYKALQQAKRKLAVKVFRLHYIKASDAMTLITKALSEDGSASVSPDAEVGITPSGDKTGGNSLAGEDTLVVRDYAENIQAVTQILEGLDVRPPQILIEATVLRASLDEDNHLGVDFNALAGIDFRTLGGTTDVYTNMTTGNLPDAKLDSFSGGTRTNFNTGFDARSFKLGIVYNNIAFFIQALEAITDTTVMGNPKLLIVNKQRGEVLVGNRDGYITTTFTEQTASETVEFLETGTKLVVRPFVGKDGYVRMEIHPEVSTGGISDAGLPFETTTECTTNVIVKDGHTLVIGGLFRESITNTRAQIPLLGNLPYVGAMFRRRDEDTNRQEVIILITPHIIRHPPDEAVGQQIKDQVLRFRMATRQSLMWHGRDRLAQQHMRWARQHLAAGDSQKALWDVNMALSMEPRMVEALLLKERLTKQAIWANESRFSSASWVVEKMILQELGHSLDQVAPRLKPRDAMKHPKDVRDALGIGPWPKLEPLARPVDAEPEQAPPLVPPPTVAPNQPEGGE